MFTINGKQSVKLEKWIIEFGNNYQQIPVPFKFYADFEYNLKGDESYKGFYTKKYQDHVPCGFAYNVVCVDDRFTQPIGVYRGEKAAHEFIKAILKEYKYCKKVMNKHFNKNLVSEKEGIYFNKVTVAVFVKNLLTMMRKKKEIIVI